MNAPFASRKVNSNNHSGNNGIHWDKLNYKWHTRISFKGSRIYLGSYKDYEDAVTTRTSAEKICSLFEDLGAEGVHVINRGTKEESLCGIIAKFGTEFTVKIQTNSCRTRDLNTVGGGL